MNKTFNQYDSNTFNKFKVASLFRKAFCGLNPERGRGGFLKYNTFKVRDSTGEDCPIKKEEAIVNIRFEASNARKTHPDGRRTLLIELKRESADYPRGKFFQDLATLLLLPSLEELPEFDSVSSSFKIDLHQLNERQGSRLYLISVIHYLNAMKTEGDLKKVERGRENKPFLILALDVETAAGVDPEDALLINQLSRIEFCKNHLDNLVEMIGVRVFEAPPSFPYKDKKFIEETQVFYRQQHSPGEKEFSELFEKFEEGEKEFTIVWCAHNAMYDATHLKRIYEQHDSRLFMKGSDNKNEKRFLSGKTTGKHNHQIVCTKLIFPKSLEDASGVRKEVFEYDLLNPIFNFETRQVVHFKKEEGGTPHFHSLDDFEKYLKKDVDSVCILLMRGKTMTRGAFETFNLGTERVPEYCFAKFLHVTQASLSKKVIIAAIRDNEPLCGGDIYQAKKYYSEVFRRALPFDQYLRERNSTLAGFVGIIENPQSSSYFYKCKKDEQIVQVDIVSSYPAIMKKSHIPGGQLFSKIPEGEKASDFVTGYLLSPKGEKEPEMNKHFAGLNCASFFRKEMFSPREKKALHLLEHYVCGEFGKLGKWICPEISKTLGRRPQKFYQRRFPIHEILVNLLIDYKLEYSKKLKSPSLTSSQRWELETYREIVKIMLNAGFGQMLKESFSKSVYYENGRVSTFQEDPVLESVLSGVYIGQMGRVVLAQQIKRVQEAGFKIFHFDTDSITFLCPKSTDLKKLFPSGGSSLGEGEIKGIFSEIYTFGVRKKYVLVPEKETDPVSVALAGIKNAPNLTKYLGANNKKRFREGMSCLTSESIGFKGAAGKSYKCRNNEEFVLFDGHKGMGDRERAKEGLKGYKTIVEINASATDFTLLKS